MNASRRDIFFAVGLILSLALVTIAAALLLPAPEEAQPAFASTSSAADGLLVWKRWLEAEGYPVRNDPQTEFEIAGDVRILMVLQPTDAFTTAETAVLENWIEQGGRLILAGNQYYTAQVAHSFEVVEKPIDPPAQEILPTAPLFLNPPVQEALPGSFDAYWEGVPAGAEPLLTADGKPVVIFLRHGRGGILFDAAPDMFTNQGLMDDRQAVLAINLIRYLDTTGIVQIDEWHHGLRLRVSEGGGMLALLAQTPIGHGVLFAAGVVFIALLLAGWPVGRPISLPHSLPRRGLMEQISAIANLQRRAGHRADILRSYHTELKRSLGRRCRLDPAQPDQEYVRQLAAINPRVDSAGLLALLQQLTRASVSEAELVRLSGQAVAWMRKE